MATLASHLLNPHIYAYLIRSKPQIRNYASAARHRALQSPATRMPPQKSLQFAMKQQAAMDMPNDIGLLPGTFIMPTGAAKPSIFREPRLRWRLEVRRFKARIENIRGAITYKYLITGKPYPKLARRKAVATATALHKRMYSAFTENDIATLSSICTEGLLASFRARLASNPRDVTQRWILHRYIKSPHIVSDRATMMQIKDAGVRQVVVRIKSSQSLVQIKRDPQTKEAATVPGSDNEKIVDEYLVIQRRIWKRREEQWRIWGTTQEVDVNKLS